MNHQTTQPERRWLMITAWVFVTVGLLGAGLGCSTDKDGDDDGDSLTPLTFEQKSDALSIFVDWENLRLTLDDVMAATPASADAEVRRAADVIRRLCAIQRAPAEGASSAATTVSTRDEEKTDRLELIAVGPNSDFRNCPIQFSQKVRRSRRLVGERQTTQGYFEFNYVALSEAASEISSVTRLVYKGQLTSIAGAVQAELIHSSLEALSGEIVFSGSETVIPIRLKKETKSRFRGAESVTQETLIRQARVGNRRLEWQRERELTDLKVSKERHLINREEVSSGDYEKLRDDVRRSR